MRPASLCWCFCFLCSLFVGWLGVAGRCCQRFSVKLLRFFLFFILFFFVFVSVGATKSTMGRFFFLLNQN